MTRPRLKAAEIAAQPRAFEVMREFLKRIRLPAQKAKELAARVPIDRDALEAVAKHMNRAPEQAEARIRSWFKDFFETADPRVQPQDLRLFLDPAKRAYYAHGKGINVGARFDEMTLFHEASHPIEHVDSAASAATKAWRDARAGAVDSGMKTKPLAEIKLDPRYERDELAYAMHDFVDDYVGKVYPNNGPATEVLTMFAQELSDAGAAVKLFARDAEHFFLGLGLLR